MADLSRRQLTTGALRACIGAAALSTAARAEEPYPSRPVELIVPFAPGGGTDLIAYLKERPGALNYASYGAGGSSHLAAELFQATTGTKMVHVPYSGGGPAALGVVSNAVQMLFPSLLPVLGMVRGGTLKPIAAAAERRRLLLPEVPTFHESGIDYRTGTWFGVLAPARTDATIIARLHGAVVDLLQDAAARDKLTEQGAEVVGNSPAEFRTFIQEETERLAVVIRSAGIQLD